jgi:hypothetical protein
MNSTVFNMMCISKHSASPGQQWLALTVTLQNKSPDSDCENIEMRIALLTCLIERKTKQTSLCITY